MKPIPYNRVEFGESEYRYIADAVARGHISGDGFYTAKCQELLAEISGVECCLLTTSCTHALEMSALLLDIGPGDEVVLPSFTFVSTANAFALRGARLRFVDIRPDTLNVDEKWLDDAVGQATRAVVVVHYAGVGCDMDAITRTCSESGAALIEDNAHGLFGAFRSRPLGSFGAFATLSFHETKNVSCGEGGALLINDESYVERAEILREKGTNRKQFFRGQVNKYTWQDIGSSYVQSELLAAVLWAQLERRDSSQAARMRIWNQYATRLADWADENDIVLPVVPDECRHPAHLFYMLFPEGSVRDGFIQHSRAADILSVFHYVPLHLSPMGRRMGYSAGDLPVTESTSERLVRLPLFAAMTVEELERVIDMVTAFNA